MDAGEILLNLTLHDAQGNTIESHTGLTADEAAVIASQFIYIHGTDPDENGRDAAAGWIRFSPITHR